jgi:hypothetical protein
MTSDARIVRPGTVRCQRAAFADLTEYLMQHLPAAEGEGAAL